MSALMLSIVSLLYLGTAIDLCLHQHYPLAMAFFCYSVANCALILTIQ